MTAVSISRLDLYNRVCSEPMRKVAKALGISDVGLAKVCRRHDIPTPPRGYWAKKSNGQSPPVKRLPNPDHDETISFQSVERFEASEEQQTAREAEPRITVANQLRSPHRLVADTLESLSLATKGEAVGPRFAPEQRTERPDNPTPGRDTETWRPVSRMIAAQQRRLHQGCLPLGPCQDISQIRQKSSK